VASTQRATTESPASASRWLVYACRTPYAAEVQEILWRAGSEVAAFVDNLPDGPQPCELGRVVSPLELSDEERALPTAIPLLTPGHRYAVTRETRAAGVMRFPNLFDPSAVIARTASCARGVIVNALAVVAAGGQIGAFVHVNRSASVGHHASIQDFVTLGPGCVLSGHVTVERGAFIGAGAVIAPTTRIGANAIVGAGAVVLRDVPAFAMVLGNPAKVFSVTDHGYGGVRVPDRSDDDAHESRMELDL
jgi:sugar O-acyltransferase (sialic acid O-acetyltransferase NeuD family)